MSAPTVEPGQVWIDNDKRLTDRRYVRVISVTDGRAQCMAWYDRVGYKARPVTIRLDRFRSTSTGYRLARAGEVPA